jgi:hypothetical protein
MDDLLKSIKTPADLLLLSTPDLGRDPSILCWKMQQDRCPSEVLPANSTPMG